MKKAILLIAAVILLGNLTSKATHIVGGEFSVQWKSGNTFHLTLNWYRDCSSVVYFDTPKVVVGIYDMVTNVKTACDSVPLVSTQILQLGDACYSPSLNGICVQLGRYEADVVIPNNPNGYYLTANRCCRNNIITNIQNPGAAGETWYAEIADPALHNSTPVFSKYPKAYFCATFPNTDSLGCTDADGDSLVYSLITPFDTHGQTNNPCPDPGPYPNISWQAPYSAANMVGGSPAMAIDRNTGLLTAKPPNLGTFVFCTRVEQYRRSDKKKMGEIRRDIQYKVTTCTPPTPPVFTAPTSNTMSVKAGDTLSFPVIVTSSSNKDTVTLTGTSVLFTNGSNTTFVQPVRHTSPLQSDFTFITTCDDTGTYHVTFSAEVESVCLTGKVTITKDIDITVLPPDVPYISLPTTNSFTIQAGDTLTFPVVANDVDPADTIYLTGESELFTGHNATFPAVAGLTTVQSTFTYVSTCKEVRDNPYHVKFTARHCFVDSSFELDVFVKVPNFDPVPNIITPNGDNKNDFFQLRDSVRGINCDFNVKVFDRWGLLMYESPTSNFKWDGTNQSGNKVAEGVYYYIIEGMVGTVEFKRRGTVNVKM